MKRPAIAKLRHHLLLCSQNDVVTKDGDMILNRTAVRALRAMIEPKKASTFSAQGAAHMDTKDARTHVITTRLSPDLEISTYAWLYEERRKSSPRWFKILSVVETEMGGRPFFVFDCRLVERGDAIVKPDDGLEADQTVVGLPHGVAL